MKCLCLLWNRWVYLLVLKTESGSVAAQFKAEKVTRGHPIYFLPIARQHPLAYGLLLMQNARPSPSSCLSASGERPFNRTCVTGCKKKRDKASKHSASIFRCLSVPLSFFLHHSPLSLSSSLLLFFPSTFLCVDAVSAFCWASGYVSIRQAVRERERERGVTELHDNWAVHSCA